MSAPSARSTPARSTYWPVAWAHVLLPSGAVFALVSGISGAAALAAGVIFALIFGNPFPEATRRASQMLLSLSVVGLGGGMDLRVIGASGPTGVIATLASISGCLLLGTLFARALRVDGHIGLLISVGTAICGASAIAAMAPTLRSREREVSVALVTVFILNAVALFVFPMIGRALSLEPQRFGLWAALAIHDTSSVIGAAAQFGEGALEVATTVKLTRALWIIPLTLAVGAIHHRPPLGRRSGAGGQQDTRTTPKPWFILGFLLVAAFVTFVPALRAPGRLVSSFAKHAMASTLFLIGSGLTRASVASVGIRPFVHGVALWFVVAGLSLAAILFHVIG